MSPTMPLSKVKLGDCLTLLTDYHANGSYKSLKENVTLLDDQNYAVMIRTTNFEKDDFDKDLKYISEHAYNYLTKSKVYPGDILMNKIATPGSVYRMPNLNRPVSLAMNLFLLRTDETCLNQTYAYYWLKANESYVKSFACGAATATITKKAVRELDLQLPDIQIQKKIAGILLTYEELIINAQQRIRILESMARTLYRKAIKSCAPALTTKPIVNSGYWRFISENVSAYPGTKRYYATADVDCLSITGPGIEYPFREKPSRAQKQPTPCSVWFARMKDTYKIAWYGASDQERATGSMLSSGFAGFEACSPDLWPLLFLTVSSKEFHAQKDLYCTGATQMSITNEGLGRIEMPLPDEETAKRLGREAGPLLNSILILQKQSDVLRRTRDLLLPRLISGQINVEAV
ncbi:MAG: restriction endonuclease subunit S [Elusimicrobiales bacterium]